MAVIRISLLAALIVGALILWNDRRVELTRENSVNKHLTRTFRVVADGAEKFATTMPPLSPMLIDSVPEIVAAARLRAGEKVLLAARDRQIFTKKYFYVDSSFLRVFEIAGEDFLTDSSSIVLTKSFAHLLFGEENSLGQIITLNGRPFHVTDVIPDPDNIHLDYDFLLNISAFRPPAFANMQTWGWMTFYNYVLLGDRSQEAAIEKQLPALLRNAGGERVANAMKLKLQPADSIYYESRFSEDGRVGLPGEIREWEWQMWSFLAVALVLIAALFTRVNNNVWRTVILLAIVFYAYRYYQARSEEADKLKHLGFDTDVTIVEFDHEALKAKYDSFKSRVSQFTVVGAGNHIMEGVSGRYQIFEEGSDKGQLMNFYPTHYDFFNAFSIPFIKRSDFAAAKTEPDTLWKFIVNEQAAELLASGQDVVGKHFFVAGQGGLHGQVVGVVKDFHFDKLEKPIGPLVLFFRPNATNFVVVKNPSEGLHKVWDDVFPDIELKSQQLTSRKDFVLRNEHAVTTMRFDLLKLMGLLCGLFLAATFLNTKRT